DSRVRRRRAHPLRRRARAHPHRRACSAPDARMPAARPLRRHRRRMSTTPPLHRRLLAEFLGSAFLAALVVGSGIAAQTLSPSDVGLQLFENAAATAACLFAIILMFGPVSGGHFHPGVSVGAACFRGISWRDAGAYLPAQVGGCMLGAITANV